MQQKKQLVKDGLAALSLGTLSFGRILSGLLNPGGSQYFSETVTNRYDYLAIIANIMMIAAMAFVCSRIVRTARSRVVDFVGVLLMLAAFLPVMDFIRRQFSLSVDDLRVWSGVVVLAIGLAMIGVGLYYWRSLGRGLYTMLLIVSPFSFLALASAGYYALEGNTPLPLAASAPFEGAQVDPSSPRVVWVIFDELDQSLLSDRKPAGLALPNLQKFARESVVASNAFPPAGRTIFSIPSLLTGKIVVDSSVRRENQLILHFRGEMPPTVFGSAHSIFSEMAEAGKRVAIVGWYLPYARLFPETSGRWVRWGAFPQTQAFSGSNLGASIVGQLKYVFWPPSTRFVNMRLFADLHRHSIRAVTSPADLVYLHYPTPHSPGIFDSKQRKLSGAFTSTVEGYLSNLQLVDRSVGEIVAKLDENKLLQNTWIILSSDHWWRESPKLDGKIAYRVPLMIRPPAQPGGRLFEAPINTVYTADLVRAIIDRRIVTEDDVIEFLMKHRSVGPYKYSPRGALLGDL